MRRRTTEAKSDVGLLQVYTDNTASTIRGVALLILCNTCFAAEFQGRTSAEPNLKSVYTLLGCLLLDYEDCGVGVNLLMKFSCEMRGVVSRPPEVVPVEYSIAQATSSRACDEKIRIVYNGNGNDFG